MALRLHLQLAASHPALLYLPNLDEVCKPVDVGSLQSRIDAVTRPIMDLKPGASVQSHQCRTHHILEYVFRRDGFSPYVISLRVCDPRVSEVNLSGFSSSPMSDRGGLPVPSPIDRLTAELRRILPASQQPTAHDTPDLVDEPPAGAPAPPTAHDSVGASEPAGAPARGLPSAYGVDSRCNIGVVTVGRLFSWCRVS